MANEISDDSEKMEDIFVVNFVKKEWQPSIRLRLKKIGFRYC